MFSNSSKYAIKAVLYIAIHGSQDNKIMAKDIAQPINVPSAYIAKLLQQLARKQIISSERGPKGGFYMTPENLSLPLYEILCAIDDEQKLQSCLLSLDECDTNSPCPLHKMINPLRSKMLLDFKSHSINDIAQLVKHGQANLPL